MRPMATKTKTVRPIKRLVWLNDKDNADTITTVGITAMLVGWIGLVIYYVGWVA